MLATSSITPFKYRNRHTSVIGELSHHTNHSGDVTVRELMVGRIGGEQAQSLDDLCEGGGMWLSSEGKQEAPMKFPHYSAQCGGIRDEGLGWVWPGEEITIWPVKNLFSTPSCVQRSSFLTCHQQQQDRVWSLLAWSREQSAQLLDTGNKQEKYCIIKNKHIITTHQVDTVNRILIMCLYPTHHGEETSI